MWSFHVPTFYFPSTHKWHSHIHESQVLWTKEHRWNYFFHLYGQLPMEFLVEWFEPLLLLKTQTKSHSVNRQANKPTQKTLFKPHLTCTLQIKTRCSCHLQGPRCSNPGPSIKAVRDWNNEATYMKNVHLKPVTVPEILLDEDISTHTNPWTHPISQIWNLRLCWEIFTHSHNALETQVRNLTLKAKIQS